MEVGRNLLSLHPPSPPKTHFRISPPSSVTMFHEVAAPAVTSLPTTSLTRQFPAPIILQEQRDEVKSLLHTRETSQAARDRRQLDGDASFVQEKEDCGSNQYLKDFERHLLDWPGLWYLLPSLQSEEKPFLSLSMQPTAPDIDNIMNSEAFDVLALAKQAMLAAKEATYLAEALHSNEDDSGEFIPGSGLTNSFPFEKEIAVRSKRHLERQSMKRKVPIQTAIIHDPKLRNTGKQRNINEKFDPDDPLRLFLSSSATYKFLTKKEETESFIHVQELVRLEEVKQRLRSDFGREPTFVEWAGAAGMSSRTLQLHILSGNSSREKMIYSNFRMVVHVAKKYQGMGLNLQDLLQEGGRGLIKSLEKFQLKKGSRFSSYAYFWIRQFIRKAIFLNSRTIRLPEGVYAEMRKVSKAKELYIQEGHQPTNEELAKRVGISVQRLETLLVSTRKPLSMQNPVWADATATYQEITADNKIENPSLSVAKQQMRQHVRNLLSSLPPRERRVIQLRFGIGGGTRKVLEEIGVEFGLSKERVRQMEVTALDRLKKCTSSHGLEAYADLLKQG